ncbi:winged helix-turn-helix domain-containing protein [Parabacteroides timonensis]|uniref:winged helix-turn-helix domain-containing protein n=1 Tax=Parabacteroides timonensis TaxID=1871013 RepID=UPI00094ED9B5|nr:winged helix-turn-helix domain-containing protein [Parabacteroides timonensis]
METEKQIIGENAGKVWHAMKEIKMITIPELARQLDLSVESTAMAVGWLARENKIYIERREGLIIIHEESRFNFCFG